VVLWWLCWVAVEVVGCSASRCRMIFEALPVELSPQRYKWEHSRVCAKASIAQRYGKWAPGSRLRSGWVDGASQSCKCRCMSWHHRWLVGCAPSPLEEHSVVGSSRHNRRQQEVVSAAACGS